ncbi:MAG: cytochrome c biogenesis protein CcsA [Myxococcota bacterium]
MATTSMLFIATAVLYSVTSALYLVALFRGTEGTTAAARASRSARSVLLVSVVAHMTYLAVDRFNDATPAMPVIHQTLTFISLGVVVAFLIALLRRPAIGVLGAFLSPVTLLFFLGSGLGRSVSEVSPEVRSALLPVHVGVSLLGIVAFALAFAAAMGYVLQERLLRQKRLGGLFQRLPPLDVLDMFGFRSVSVGFPLLTLGIITGAFWTLRIRPDAPPLAPTHVFAIVSWVLFALVLVLRVAGGWRGRRAAFGTILGFLSSAAVLLGYMLRGGGA